MQEMQVRSLGQKYTLEKEMVTRSSILAGEIPWTEEPGGPKSMGPRGGHSFVTHPKGSIALPRGSGTVFREFAGS